MYFAICAPNWKKKLGKTWMQMVSVRAFMKFRLNTEKILKEETLQFAHLFFKNLIDNLYNEFILAYHI